MRHLILKTCVAGACALGFVAFGGPAQALSPLALDQGRSLVLQVQDQEDLSVEENLRPDEEPIVLEDEGVKPKEGMPEESMGEGKGGMEDEMINKIGPGAE
jgi:hypothetical protein